MSVNLPAAMRTIAELWPKTSEKGNPYFVGGNGSEKLWLFYNADAGEGEAPWLLCIEDNDDAENWTISQLFPGGGESK